MMPTLVGIIQWGEDKINIISILLTQDSKIVFHIIRVMYLLSILTQVSNRIHSCQVTIMVLLVKMNREQQINIHKNFIDTIFIR